MSELGRALRDAITTTGRAALSTVSVCTTLILIREAEPLLPGSVSV